MPRYSSKDGYRSESWNTPRFSKKPFPGAADFKGLAPGAAGKGYSKATPDLPSREQYKAFPKNKGQFD